MSRPIVFGEIEGFPEGHRFEGRKEMMPNSFHRNWGAGIEYDVFRMVWIYRHGNGCRRCKSHPREMPEREQVFQSLEHEVERRY